MSATPGQMANDVPARPIPEDVIANRSGNVLIKHTVLKADHFPSCHNTKLTPILEGAPNFRKVDGMPVYGVAIPTVTGLRNVLHALNASNGQRKVYWQNLREEPLVFINGQPFVVREADQPFSNLEYTGIDRTRVEEMEVRLKNDILAEAKKFGNQILVVHENADLSLYDHWEPVTGVDVQTPQEVYAECKADGFDVDYLRIPVTDEKAPKDQDFEQLIQRLWTVPLDAALIFNCQMGRGRTTTGMIIASLLHLRKIDAFPLHKKPDTRDIVPEWFRQLSVKMASKHAEQERDKLKAGMYGVVRSLLRALEKGPEAKIVLDSVIDASSAMQNLRDGINSYRARFLKESRERQRNTLLSVCLEYLERYYMLIAFTGYLQSPQFDPGATFHRSFPVWMEERVELRSILMRLLRRNSMAALELHVTAHPAGASEGGGEASNDKEKDVVAMRSGAVLGPFTVLKEDNYPGMQSARVPQQIEGAPNFRRMSFMPIFGVGMPTVDGVIGVLKAVSGSTSPNASKRVHALWINMREEPVVYINGKPFVLREEVRPLKNMMEYAGIDAVRLEAMEERLKKDVLAEALKYGGRILVAQESFEPGHYGELFDTWEEIDHPDAVQTMHEVYTSLTKQGFAVQYARIPVTDGETPSLSDFDAVIGNILDFGIESPVIFNCQMGNCRTTMGMVIAGMVHIYSEGALDAARDSKMALDDVHDAADLGRYVVAGISPRSDGDGEPDEYGGWNDGEDEEMEPKVWDLEPEEVEEQRSLAAGGYVGVRRVVRLLEEGEGSKKVVDSIADACSELINLRVAIMKYRKPRSSYKYLRPELQQRTAAFKRGSAYLERYCMLIAFAFYLEHVGPESMPFSAWLESRPDLMSAMKAIQLNPAAALAPVPVAKVPALYQAAEGAVDLNEQKRVLSKRRGRTVGQRTILKSYVVDPSAPHSGIGEEPFSDLNHVRKADNLPIYSVANVNTRELQALLTKLGACPDASAMQMGYGPAYLVDAAPAAPHHTHVLITDVREELVVYINGTPYIRRELEMPAAALHHAGVHAQQLEELEVLLKEDVQDEAAKWTGRILLHRELPPADAQLGAPGSGEGAAGSREGAAAGGEASSGVRSAEEAGAAGATMFGLKTDDVTALVDRNPGAAVAPFWEDVDLSTPSSLRSPRDMVESLASPEGGSFSVSYARIPLSRERTPEAQDVAQLHQVLMEAVQRREQGQQVVHLILSRTATGSSARFVAAALGCYYVPPADVARLPTSPTASKALALNPEHGEYRGIMALCRLLPGGFDAKVTVDTAIKACSQMGNLIADIRKCQLQSGKSGPSGPSAVPVGMGEAETGGAAAPSAAAPAAPAPVAVTAVPPAEGTATAKGADMLQFAARQLGIHYLKRYFLLICYRAYLEKSGLQAAVTFDEWVHAQRELEHLLGHLTLDV